MKRKRIWLVIGCIAIVCLLFAGAIFWYHGSRKAERTVYADQGGVAVFEENGKVGLLDSNGNVLLPAEYDDISPFGTSEWTTLRQDNLKGAVCKDGRMVIECAWNDYVWIIPQAGFGVVSNMNDGQTFETLIDLNTGDILRDEPQHVYWADEKYVYDLLAAYYDGWESSGPYRLVICDLSLNPLLILDDIGDAEPFVGGFVTYSEHFRWNPGTYTIIDLEGRMLLDDIKKYEIVAEGVYYVRRESDGRAYCGLVNADGVAFEVEGTQIWPKDDAGLCRVYQGAGASSWSQHENSCYGYVDGTGEWVIEPKYEDIGPFVCGSAVVREDGHYHLIDPNGCRINDLEWSRKTCMTLPVVPVDTEEGLKLVDRNGSPLSEEVFDPSFQDTYGELLLLRDVAGRLCAIETDGTVLLRMDAEDQETDMGDGSAIWIKTGGLWGLMELREPLTGQWRISPRFRWVYKYSANKEEPVYATFEDGGKAYIDAKGNPYGPLIYTVD